MTHSADNIGWTSALLALVEAARPTPVETPIVAEEIARNSLDQADDEREPFHLDDTELATRLVRDRGLVHYRTPPHTHLIFPPVPPR